MGILPCPIFSAKPTYTISSHNCHRNVSPPSGASLGNDMFGRVEGQYTTRVLVIHFFFFLSTRPFGYAVSFPIFDSKIFLLPLYLVVGVSSYILHQLVFHCHN